MISCLSVIKWINSLKNNIEYFLFVFQKRKEDKLCVVVVVGISKTSLKKTREKWKIIWFQERKITTTMILHFHDIATELITALLQAGPNCFNSMFFSGGISSINRTYDITLKLSVLTQVNYLLPLNHTT